MSRPIDGTSLKNELYKAVRECQARDMDLVGQGLLNAIGILNTQPTIEPKRGEWIPCEERLPSEQGHYLVTFPLCDGEPWVYVLSFHKGKFYETDDEWGDVEYDDVIAWMPLPQPYNGARMTERSE